MTNHSLRALCLIAFAFVGTDCFAASVGQSAVAKVVSDTCGQQHSAAAIAGSGVLVSAGAQELFVLTGAHVIYHGGASAGICFEASFDADAASGAVAAAIPPTCVDFYSANILLDLALLKVDASCLSPELAAGLAARALPIGRFKEDYDAIKAAGGDEAVVSIIGYPSGLTARRTYRGAIQAFDSQRHLIPGIDGLFEVSPLQSASVTSEFGMSGGLISGASHVAGLSTQHYFRIQPGQPVVVGSTEAGAAPTDATDQEVVITLGIPGDLIAAWVDKATNAADRAGFAADLGLQLAGRTGVEFAGLRLTEQNCSHRQSWWIGGHGASIGGSAPASSGTVDSCTITVEYLATPPAQTWPWSDTSVVWQDLSDRRLAGQIRSVRDRDGVDRPIASLSGLLKAVRLGFTPILAQVWQIDDAAWTSLRTTELQTLETFKAARNWIRLLPGGLDTIAAQKQALRDEAARFVDAAPTERQRLWDSMVLFNADGRTVEAGSQKKIHLMIANSLEILVGRGDQRSVCGIRKLSFGLYLWWAQSNDIMDDKLREARATNANVVTGFPQVTLDDQDFWSYVLMGVADQNVADWWDCLPTSERGQMWGVFSAEERRSLRRSVFSLSTHRDAVSDLYKLINPNG